MTRSRGAAEVSAALASTARTTRVSPAQADKAEGDVLRAIGACTDPDDAEDLLGKTKLYEHAVLLSELGADRERRWRTVRLKAERKLGELLPPVKTGRPKGRNVRSADVSKGRNVRSADVSARREAKSQARKVAAVPREQFEEYVKNDPKPTREGLLRKTAKPRTVRARRASEPTLKGKRGLSHDPAVIDWVRTKTRAGWDRDRLVKASKSGTDGWPRTDGSLTNGGVSECRAAIAALEAQKAADRKSTRRKAPTDSGVRKRQISLKKKAITDHSSDPYKLLLLSYQMMRLVAMLEAMDLLDFGIAEAEQDAISTIFDYLGTLDKWTQHGLKITGAYLNQASKRELVRKLTVVASDRSSTEGERENARRLLAAIEERRQVASRNGAP